jgi:hypothetical protein
VTVELTVTRSTIYKLYQQLVDFLRGVRKEHEFVFTSMIHARACHAVTDDKVLHAQTVIVPAHNRAKLTRQA